VRALCKIPADHVSNAHFASAGNDAVIRLWTLEGRQVAQLYGHENFIYSLAVLPGGELVSSSEDRTARIWKGDQCIQTITHPAISVWSVAASQDSGDIVTGASDRIVRVFTRSNERKGDDQTLREFEESVKSSSIPQQQVGNINKENIPGPEFLQQKSGTKEGQVQMIKEANGAISAYQWSIATQEWINIGTVVDAVGSSGKKITHQGQDYDYVFDVDIEDGKPPLKLPYNISQNPYEAARKFVEDNKLPITYLDQVANFIVSNTQGATLGQSSNSATAPPGSDPWGTESRYRPGEVGAPNPPPAPESRPKILPQTQYLSIITANLRTIEKKVKELNDQLLEQGRKDVSLSPSDLSVLSATLKQLERAQSSAQPDASNPALNEGIAIVIKMVTDWPTDKRLPGLDILRLLAAASPSTVSYTSSGEHTVVDVLGSSGVFSPDSPPNNTMLAIRTLANFCNTEAGRLIVDGTFEQIHSFVQPFIKSYTSSQNRNLTIAITTLYINFAVLLIESAGRSEGLTANADRALTLLDDLTRLISSVVDSEALYRALIAAGTLLSLGQDFRSAAREVFEIESALSKAQKVGVEPRIKAAIAEIRDLLA
jgi:phospholipase A-2-activating protein